MELLEKHFTLSRDMEGPDHPFALEPGELKAMVVAIREVEAALGNGRFEGPSEEEREEMLTTKRPGYGISPKHLEVVVGRPARVDIEADDVLTWEMV